MNSYYPVFLNVSRKRCVVVGGGPVALRKVLGLLECGASVTVISPEVCPALDKLAQESEINLERRVYRTGDLAGVFLAVAATDAHDINIMISKEAGETGALVNVVDDAGNSDFIAPSHFRRGDLTIAISTSGRSPALARKLRTKLEEDFGAEWEHLTLLIDDVRNELKREGIRVDGEAWQRALDLDVLCNLLRDGEKEKAKALLLANLKALQSPECQTINITKSS